MREKKNKYSAHKYLLKVDDDSYVQLPLVLEELKNSNFDKSLYWGFFDGRAPVWLKGKWAEKEYHLCDKYIPYALGGGYVLSHVRRILFYLERLIYFTFGFFHQKKEMYQTIFLI